MVRRKNDTGARPGAAGLAELKTAFAAAVALHKAGDLEAAVAAYRRLARRFPGVGEVQNNLGRALDALGRADAAETAFRRAVALNPALTEARTNLARVLTGRGRVDAAIAVCREALARDPGHARTRNTLGTLLRVKGDPEASLAEIGKALELRPGYHQALNNLGVSLLAMDRPEEALVAFAKAADLAPAYAAARANLGTALVHLKRPAEALAPCREAVDLAPDDPAVINDLGNACQANGRFAEAEAAFRRAVALNPRKVEALNNLAVVLRTLNRLDESIATYERALALAPEVPKLRLNHAMALLQAGRFREGWRAYEWRWKTERLLAHPIPGGRPRWRGEPLGGRTLLFHGEQGLGDTLQFIRYAPRIAARGGRVVIRVSEKLTRLLAPCAGVAACVGYHDPVPPHDLVLPMMSAPLAFGTEWDTIPAEIPYVAADPGLAARWRERLADLSGFRVGLVWSGDPRPGDYEAATMNGRRSVALSALAPLAAVPGVSLVSLQMGAARDEIAENPAVPLADPMGEVADFADTAAVAAALDLVVSVDTSVAHLAGAMGLPVWILSRYDGCWRWRRDSDATPWYPTARLFHQQAPGDWAAVIDRVARALAEVIPKAEEPS